MLKKQSRAWWCTLVIPVLVWWKQGDYYGSLATQPSQLVSSGQSETLSQEIKINIKAGSSWETILRAILCPSQVHEHICIWLTPLHTWYSHMHTYPYTQFKKKLLRSSDFSERTLTNIYVGCKEQVGPKPMCSASLGSRPSLCFLPTFLIRALLPSFPEGREHKWCHWQRSQHRVPLPQTFKTCSVIGLAFGPCLVLLTEFL